MKITAVFLSLILLITSFASCGVSEATNKSGKKDEYIINTDKNDTSVNNDKQNGAEISDTSQTYKADFSKTDSDMFTERDGRVEYSENKAVKIALKGNTATASAKSVKISGTTVTLTEDATYIISGSLDDGMIIVDVPETAKIQIVLDNVNITSSTSAPLYIKEADKVFVTLVGENTLSSGDVFDAIDENDIDAAVFSKQDLTINGSGSLNVNSPIGHGIVSKDDLVFIGSKISIVSASHGIDANDSVRIKDAIITVDAGKDGIRAENNDDASKGFVYISSGSLDIECEGDGISSSSYTHVVDGKFEILAGGGYENGTKQSSGGWGDFGGRPGGYGGGRPQGGGNGGRSSSSGTGASAQSSDSSSSMKGIKAQGDMLISGGEFTINSADDALHSNSTITVNDGSFEIATGDDALHADDTLTVNGGDFNITKSYEGLEAHHVAVNGGNVKLVATDDGINAAGGNDESGMGGRDNKYGGYGGGFPGHSGNSDGSIVITDGTLYINSSGDGMDANGTLTINGGHITVVGPTTGDTTTLDYDVSGIINGGTFIGTGSSMMAQSFSGSEQGVIALSVGTQSAGTQIVISDKNGKALVTHSPELPFQIVIVSTPELVSGETYTVKVGTQTGDFQAS